MSIEGEMKRDAGERRSGGAGWRRHDGGGKRRGAGERRIDGAGERRYDAGGRRPGVEMRRLVGGTKSNGDRNMSGAGRKKNGTGRKKNGAGTNMSGAGKRKNGGDMNSITGGMLPQNIIGEYPAAASKHPNNRQAQSWPVMSQVRICSVTAFALGGSRFARTMTV
jgi:hypothetical protein